MIENGQKAKEHAQSAKPFEPQNAASRRLFWHASCVRPEDLASELNLTADQVDKIRARMIVAAKDAAAPLDSQKIEAHLEVFGQAFENASFDARSLSSARAANTLLASWGAARMAHFFESVNPVVTPEQRSALAQNLRQHMSHQEGQDGP